MHFFVARNHSVILPKSNRRSRSIIVAPDAVTVVIRFGGKA